MRPPLIPAAAIAAYDAFTHEHRDRRQLLADLVRATGSLAAASAILPLIAADAGAAPLVAETDARLRVHMHALTLDTGRTLRLYEAQPRATNGRIPAVIVIHENRGLNAHTKDVARRVALAGFAAHAPDFLTIAGGTPADEDAARAAIGALDRAQSVADAAALARHLQAEHQRVGAVGFCWGGGMVNALAVEAGGALAAAVPYYGPAPAAGGAARIRAALLIQLAGVDERINAGYPAFEAELKAAGIAYTAHVYAGAQHAFNNDTAVGRYDKATADLAWQRTLAFFAQHLKG